MKRSSLLAALAFIFSIMNRGVCIFIHVSQFVIAELIFAFLKRSWNIVQVTFSECACVCVWIECPCQPPGTDIPSALAFPCSFHTTALLIKHNLLPISALFASLLTHTRSPSPFLAALPHLVTVAPNQGPVAKATSISFLKCQFALLSSRFHFPAIISLSVLSLFPLFAYWTPHKIFDIQQIYDIWWECSFRL